MAIYVKSDKGTDAAQPKPVPIKTAPAKPAESDTADVQHVRGTQASPAQPLAQPTPRRRISGHTGNHAPKPVPQKEQKPGNNESQAVQDKMRRNTTPRQDSAAEKNKTEDKAKTDRKTKVDPKRDAKPGTNPLSEDSKDKENKQYNKI